MTKDEIKFFFDNQETIFGEISKRLESLGQEIELPSDVSAENIRDVYDEYYKHCSDIFDKYNLDYDAFKAIFSISRRDKSFREQILGRDGANQLLRDIIDIYGDEAYDILKCNSYDFEMSEIDGILLGENNQKYEDFYTKLLNQKCEQAPTLEQLTNILLSTKPEYINQELIENFLKSPDKKISNANIRKFIDTAPSIIINGNTVKALVDRLDDINDASILAEIPSELFDEGFSRSLLEKSVTHVFSDIFSMIPEEIKNRNMWEFAISRESSIIYSLPEQKIDENMTDEEYRKWCNELVVDVIRNNPDNIQNIFSNLRDFQKTIEVFTEGARLLQSSNAREFLNQIPEESRTRQIYEILLQKSEEIISEIPSETFEEGLSQEEYETWMEDIIAQKIPEIDDPNRLLNYFETLRKIMPERAMTEKVWNAFINKCDEKNINKSKFSLSSVPIQNITIEMCERALKEIGLKQIIYIPSVDRKTDSISSDTLREKYEKWIEGFSEEEKQEYRQWYEGIVIDLIKGNRVNLFVDDFEKNFDYAFNSAKIPPEAITINIINAYLQEIGPNGIKDIPRPNNLTNYNEQYEDIILSAISMLKEKNYLDESEPGQDLLESVDILNKIPEEYRTDKVILEAIKKHPKYLRYADIESENFEELLQIAYKSKLASIGRTELSEKEIELMKKFARNNSSLFPTLKLEILTPEIISSIGESSLEKIVRYAYVQDCIIDIAKDKDALITFGFALENLKQDSLFIEPLIEQLSKTILAEEISSYNSETKKSEVKPSEFLILASNRIQDNTIPLTEEERIIISYLALNPQEAGKIKSYDEILNFVVNRNAELDGIISAQDVTLVDAKSAYFERIVGMDYNSVIELVRKYGNDPEQLLAKYEGKELATYREKSEKESLEIIIKLKSLIEETDLGKIRQAYQETVKKEDKTKAFERYRYSTILDRTLRRAYGRDITRTIGDHDKENNTEFIEHTKDGQEYVVRKMHGPFKRMISLMNAYNNSDVEEGDMYDRWNTSAMADNHALCYSSIDESNPGTAMLGDKKGIIIAISGFEAEAVTAVAPYDLWSNSRKNITITFREQRFYIADNLPNQTRDGYSEVDIEIQDVSEGVTGYKKIQPVSIICFEEVDEDSINAAIELSKKLGRTIPIELIDRRELASQVRTEIDELLEQFKSGESLQPELIGQIITKFNNVRNAHLDSSLKDELLGERKGRENSEAIFNKAHLNEMLSECIEIVKQRIEEGGVQEGLETIEQIKQFIKIEREKHEMMPTMYEKQIMAGIDLDIDYSLDEIQREYGSQEISADKRSESLELIQTNSELSSTTFEMIYGESTTMPEQMSFSEFRDSIDISEIQSIAKEIHEKGYYSKNKSHSEEHIVRVAMFSNAIATLEGQDEKTKQLLGEVVKYYCSGGILDIEEEPHQEYSARIAGKELGERYSKTDLGIIQSAIELQNLQYSSISSDERKKQRDEKIAELCSKYGLRQNDLKIVETIVTYLEDGIELDKARITPQENIRPREKFDFKSLKTDTAKSLVMASYCMQDQLSVEHLKQMAKVAHINYNEEKDKIMEELFTKIFAMRQQRTFHKNITESPIVQEEYFRHKYREIADPIKVGRELEQIQEKMQTEITTETPVYTEQQIGRATINVPTEEKDKAKEKIETQTIQQQIDEK